MERKILSTVLIALFPLFVIGVLLVCMHLTSNNKVEMLPVEYKAGKVVLDVKGGDEIC